MFDYNEAGLTRSSKETVQQVAAAFGVTIRLQAGEGPITLAPDGIERSTGSGQIICRYRDEEDTVHVRLLLHFDGNLAVGSVEAETVNGSDFGPQRFFAPENGIVLTFKPLEQISGLMANYQHKDWWTRPYFGTEPAALPERTQSVLWQTASGYYHLLPVVGPVYRIDAAGSGEGIALRLSAHESGLTQCAATAFVLAAGDDPYQLVRNNVDAALQALDYPTLPRGSKTYPEILDRFGWCSWDAFYHGVNEEGLLAKADELRRLGLPVGWVMIDDGWSEVKDGKLESFEADPVKFPQGLGHAVAELKTKYGIPHVGVWHTIAGYWGGIHPDSKIAAKLRDSLYEVPRGSLIPYPEAGRGFGFWHAWHGFLQRQGIDFVKVDSQSAVLNFLKGQRAIGEAAAAAHEALEASVALHFNDTIINCMGMAAENIWHRPKSAVSRNSDDFVPQEKRGFPEHALQNAYNSFYHGAFYWGDWDMYWTKNHDDVQSAVLRAVSGGPVYISDAPGNTDPDKVWPLIYKDGTIIRCDETPSPTTDCLLRDPTEEPVPLKLWNKAGGAGIVAAFHIGRQSAGLEGRVGPCDVPGLVLQGTDFAVYEHFSRSCVLVKAEETIPFRLEEGACAVYTIMPIHGPVAPIGLAGKIISSHAIRSFLKEDRRAVTVLREGGTFAFVSREEPHQVLCNGADIRFWKTGDCSYEADCREAAGDAIVEIKLP